MTSARNTRNGAATSRISVVLRLLQVTIPKTPEELLEGAFEAPGFLKGEEHVVHREARDVIGRIAPFAARTVQHAELGSAAEEDVPRMEVAMDLAKAVHPAFQLQPPVHALLFDHGELRPIGWQCFRRIAVDQAHNALRVADELPYPPDVKTLSLAFHPMDLGQVIAKRVPAFFIRLAKVAGIPDPFEICGVRHAFAIIG